MDTVIKTTHPHAIFETLRSAGYDAVLLESGEGTNGWTFIGIVNKAVRVPEGEKGLLFMRDFVRRNFRPKKDGEPPFTSGFVGFVSYDLGAKWLMSLRAPTYVGAKQSPVPEAHFVYVDKVIAFCLPTFGNKSPQALKQSIPISVPYSNLNKEKYCSKIQKIKEYLFAGETYQVNFSQKFEAPFDGEAFELYKKVTAINPSPFQFFIETPEFAVISNSPERLFRVESRGYRIIETRPIKGTVPRGETEQEDEQNIQKLLASEKDKAELAMIVDLERNDLGKLCMPGTVEVTENRTIEKYSHVIHTVSNIRGVMLQQYDWYDALRALHPGGSITGCPKKRTAEIIAELEDTPRGVYCGAAGYIDLSGQCDFNIMIRTLFWGIAAGDTVSPISSVPTLSLRSRSGHSPPFPLAAFARDPQDPSECCEKSGILTFRSGGGIVVDSDPQKEYEETLHKAAAMARAIFECRSKV